MNTNNRKKNKINKNSSFNTEREVWRGRHIKIQHMADHLIDRCEKIMKIKINL